VRARTRVRTHVGLKSGQMCKMAEIPQWAWLVEAGIYWLFVFGTGFEV